MTDIELGAFLSGPQNPEREALLRLIGASILDPQGAEAEAETAAVNTGWVAAFIPTPVMRGFIEGLICVTIIGQVPHLLGIEGTSPYHDDLFDAALLGLESATGIDGVPTRKHRFAGDSPLEEGGFELVVPF